MLARRWGLPNRLASAIERHHNEDAEGEATIAERRKSADEAERAAILETPIVKAAFEAFPDAVLENWNKEASV